MRASRWCAALLGTLVLLWLSVGASSAQELPRAYLIRADRVLDGRGGVLEGAAVLVRGDTILAVGAEAERRATSVAGVETVDLTGTTLLPGLIDTHVHLTSHFDRGNGRVHSNNPSETAAHAALYMVENASRMLRSGFTTVQSLGARGDADMRDWAIRGEIPSPRILTSLGSVRDGSPDEMRAAVREFHEAGADLIKVFASASIRDGGTATLSQEQLDAACGEARRLGLRTAVHAHVSESVSRAVRAGCTTIEHGALVDRATLELMAQRGAYYDPNIHLIFQNYFDNKPRYFGTGNYTEEGFAHMEAAVPKALAVFREALTVPGLKIVFGTDAVAGAHGRHVEELIYRVREGGQDPMGALVSATSVSAESLGLGARIGAVMPGMAADLIAVTGDPRQEIEQMREVRFVMRGGRVWDR